MRKRLIEIRKNKKGYTMTELLMVIGIIAVVCAIAIPSIVMISRSLRFKQRNDYAKSVFMAAQQNLTEMRSDGELDVLQASSGTYLIPAGGGFPDEFRTEYVYTYTDEDAFNLVLPVGSVDSSVRDANIIIEYNPLTGNVYSVFYSEERGGILDGYRSGSLPRDKDENDRKARKDLMLGYYDGSGMNHMELEMETTQAMVQFTNGQEGMVSVLIPMPESYYGSSQEFISALSVKLSITGEQSAVLAAQRGEPAPLPLELTIKNSGDVRTVNGDACELSRVDHKTVVVNFPIDSLKDAKSFANYAAGSEEALTKLASEDEFAGILPGENVTIQADVTVDGTSSGMIQVDPGILGGVNPMFEYLQPIDDNKYVLAISNGRNMQNLNAIAPTIANMVENVAFVADINWNDTVNYYNVNYGGASESYRNSIEEAPARQLPYFVPIHNAAMFGTAKFIYPASHNEGNILQQLLGPIFGFTSNVRVPTLTDELDSRQDASGKELAESHATISGTDEDNGDGVQIYYLNIDTTKYPVGKPYYAGTADADIDRFTGLFSYVNTTIENLHVVNPIVKGYKFVDQNNPATGALVGAAGYNTYISNCSTYIDTKDDGFSRSKMSHGAYSASEDQNWYGVSGEGAVGGLVGYAKSHRVTTGELSNDRTVLAFSKSFAAVNVSGTMREATQKTLTNSWFSSKKYYGYSKDYGYSNGVGGFIGNSQLTNFYNCYASGNVKAVRCNIAETWGTSNSWINDLLGLFGIDVDLMYSGRESVGAGGFVGTSHGTRYTNCFATGDVTATAYSDLGAGSFVGMMCIDENRTYGNYSGDSDGVEVAQRTIFTNCYAVGLSTTNSKPVENFSGANGRVVFDIEEYSTYAVGDYYRLYAPYYHYYGRVPQYNDSVYFYRDSYFLNYPERVSNAQQNSTNCASPVGYDVLQNLPGTHKNTTWINSQIDEIKSIPLKTIFGITLSTYEHSYFQNGWGRDNGMTDRYRALYQEGYQSGWEPATASTTHSYSYTTTGATYPFSKLVGLDYYGDWPSKPSDVGLAYYEIYEDEPDKRYYLFDKDRSSTDVRLGLRNDDAVVIEDGYAVFSINKSALTVKAGDVSQKLNYSGDEFTFNGNKYYAFILSTDQMKELPEGDGEFYVKVTADGHTMYFNPNSARTHENPMEGRKEAAKPDSAPDQFYIRSARQFAKISTLDDLWSKDYKYIQELNIDASKYDWESDNDKKLGTIGTTEKPFNATYTTLVEKTDGTTMKQAELSGFIPTGAGIFGVVGEKGKVEKLNVEIKDNITLGNANTADVAVLVGRNEGTVANVDLTLKGTAALTAKNNAGLLVGYNSGAATGTEKDTCSILAEEAVTITAPNAGAVFGAAEGTADKQLSITNCDLELKKALTINNATNVGGFFGVAKNLNAQDLKVTTNGLSVNADYVGALAGIAENVVFNTVELTLAGDLTNSKAEGVAAGAVGYAKNVTMTSVDVSKTSGTLSAATAAGFLAVAEEVKANDCEIAMGGTISGSAKAAGVVAELTGSGKLEKVNVNLSGAKVTSETGDAAGYGITVGGQILNSRVTLGNNAQISAGNNAAGYAVTVKGAVDNGAVMGAGKITGVRAAGFAVEVAAEGTQAQVVNSGVTPVVTAANATKDAIKAAYQGKSNSALQVVAKAGETSEAAGFILTVGEEELVEDCYTLCTVSGTKAYGFAGINGGTIKDCTANIDITGGYAFVGVNNALVARSYGWYGNGVEKDEVATDATLDEGTGKCFSAYFADRDIPDLFGIAENAVPSVVLYKADGKLSEAIKSPSQLRSNGAQELASAEYTWTASAAQYEYPYSSNLANEEYEYPTIRAHYGDWVVPPKFAYGVIYYETYDDGSFKVRIEDLANSQDSASVEKKSLDTGCLLVSKAVAATDPTGTTTNGYSITESSFNETGNIQTAGYALFCRTDEQKSTFKSMAGEAITTIPMDILPSNYPSCYSIYAVQGSGEASVSAEDGRESVTVDFRFANAIDDTDGTYEVRTQDQLANIGAVSANFNQTHDIVVESGKLVQAAALAEGKKYSGNNLSLTMTNPETCWIETVAGTVENLELIIEGDATKPVFGTVSGTVSLKNVNVKGGLTAKEANALVTTVSGTFTCPSISISGGIDAGNALFGTVSGTVGNTEVKVDGTVSGSLINTVSGENAKVTLSDFTTGDLPGTLIGTVAGGQVNMGAIKTGTVGGSVVGEVTGGSITTNAISTDAVTGKVFGDVAGTVNTGAVTINGAAKQVLGNVNSGSITTGAISTKGETGQVFGDVKAPVTVTNGITTGKASANQIFGEIKADVTVGGITTGAVAADKAVVVLVSGGTSNLGAITTGEVTGSVIGSVTGGSITTETIKTDAVTGKVFGDVAGTVNTGAITTGTVGTEEKASQLFGNITSGCVTVDGSISVPIVYGKIFGFVGEKDKNSADVTVTGAIKVGATSADGEFTGGAVNQVFGDINKGSVNVTGAIQIGAAGKVFGDIAAAVTKVEIAQITTNNNTVTGQVFGDVKAPVTVTNGITTGTASANQIFGEIKADVTAGGITTGAVAADKAVVKLVSAGTSNLGAISTGEVTGSVVDSVTGGSVTTGTIKTGAVTGKVFGDMAGIVKTDAITAGIVGTEEKASQLFGNITSGSVTVDGSISVPIVYGKIFGFVGEKDKNSADVTVTGAIKVGATAADGEFTGGAVNQIFGDINKGSVNVTGTIQAGATGQVFGNVAGTVTTKAITTGAVSQVFGDVTAGTVNLGDITVKNTTFVGTLFGPISGSKTTVSGGKVVLGNADISGNLIASVTEGATVKDFAISAKSMNASLVGGSLAGTLNNVDVTVTGTSEVTFTGNGLLVSNVTSGTVQSCDVSVAHPVAVKVAADPADGFYPFGGITGVAAKDVDMTSNTVSATLNVQGADDRLAVIGGLVGKNNADISGGNANVTTTYTQTTKDQVRIGGIVAWMRGGKLSGTTAGGEIKLASGSGSGRQNYFIGGAVAYDDGVTYESVSTAVKLTGSWATKNAVTPGCPAGKGAVGMFVGYVNNGRFKDCSSTADNSTYQFLGEIATTTKNTSKLVDNVATAVFGNSTLYTETQTVNSDKTTGVFAGYTQYVDSSHKDYVSYLATLNQCTFVADGKEYIQGYQAQEYFYKQSDVKRYNEYSTSAVKLSISSGTVTPTLSSMLNKDGKRVKTSYLYKDGDRYYPVYVTRTSGTENYVFGYIEYVFEYTTDGSTYKNAGDTWRKSEFFSRPSTDVKCPNAYYTCDVAIVAGSNYIIENENGQMLVANNNSVGTEAYTSPFYSVDTRMVWQPTAGSASTSWKNVLTGKYLQSNMSGLGNAKDIAFTVVAPNGCTTDTDAELSINGNTYKLRTVEATGKFYNTAKFTVISPATNVYECDMRCVATPTGKTVNEASLDDATPPTDGTAVSGETQNPNT